MVMDDLLRLGEVREELGGISAAAVHQLAKRGRLRRVATRWGYGYLREDVERWKEVRASPPRRGRGPHPHRESVSA